MNNKVISLTKVIFKNSFQNFENKTFSNNNKKSKNMVILYLIIFLYIGGIVVYFSNQIIKTLMQVNQEQAFIGLIFMAIMAFMLFQSIFSCMSLLYYSKDNEYILPLPIKSTQIIMAKTNVLFITEYLVEIIIGLIPLIVYGQLTGASGGYYIVVLILLVIFPILPIMISSILVMLIMSISKFSKNKNRFQVISTILIMAFVMYISFTTSSNQMSEEAIIQLVNQVNGLSQIVRGYFPTLGPAIDALTTNSITEIVWNLGKIVLITVGSYVLYLALANKLYFKGAVGSLSSGVKSNKKLNDKVVFKKNNLIKTYIGKEFKILLRNPVFLMQCILPAILFPILFIGITIFSMQTEGSASVTEMFKELGSTSKILIGQGLLIAMQFFSMFIYISITAISRDGANAVFMKYIPISLLKQLEYKIMPNVIMNSIMNIIVIVIAQYLLQTSIIYLVLIFITALIMSILQSYLMIAMDLRKPKLDWSSEYAVVKQNMNLIWPPIMSIVNITIIYFVFAYISNKIDNSYIIIVFLGVIYGLAIIVVRNYIKKNIVKLFEKIY